MKNSQFVWVFVIAVAFIIWFIFFKSHSASIPGFYAVKGGHMLKAGETWYFKKNGDLFCVGNHDSLLLSAMFWSRSAGFKGKWSLHGKDLRVSVTLDFGLGKISAEDNFTISLMDSNKIIAKSQKGEVSEFLRIPENSPLVKEMFKELDYWGISGYK